MLSARDDFQVIQARVPCLNDDHLTQRFQLRILSHLPEKLIVCCFVARFDDEVIAFAMLPLRQTIILYFRFHLFPPSLSVFSSSPAGNQRCAIHCLFHRFSDCASIFFWTSLSCGVSHLSFSDQGLLGVFRISAVALPRFSSDTAQLFKHANLVPSARVRQL